MSGKKANLAVSLGMVLAVLGTCAVAAQDIATRLDQIMVGAHRSDANKARDKYRHPKETLLFFGLQPDMTVVEISPGRGWYTEIIAPALRQDGQYFAAVSAVTEKTPDFLRQNDADYRAMLAAAPDLYGHAKLSVLAPGALQVAPPGSAHMVLTFRNVHNWAKAGSADAMFKAFYDALKKGGTLGVVEHRAKPGTPFQQQVDSGYMTEAYVDRHGTESRFQAGEQGRNQRQSQGHQGSRGRGLELAAEPAFRRRRIGKNTWRSENRIA